ncbi:MAG TPA: response regulator transcription factor, partial [Savagea sp.]
MIRILLVDDHEMVRIGVSTYLKLQQDMEVVGEASDGEEAVEKALALRPDIILMDMVMPKKSGAETTADI